MRREVITQPGVIVALQCWRYRRESRRVTRVEHLALKAHVRQARIEVAAGSRPDVRPETDLVTVQGAQILRYKIRVVAKINAGPDSGLTQVAAQRLLQTYAESCHRLLGVNPRDSTA